MSTETRNWCECLGCGVCKGAWFCYVVCLALPVLTLLVVLLGAAVLLLLP